MHPEYNPSLGSVAGADLALLEVTMQQNKHNQPLYPIRLNWDPLIPDLSHNAMVLGFGRGSVPDPNWTGEDLEYQYVVRSKPVGVFLQTACLKFAPTLYSRYRLGSTSRDSASRLST